MAQLTAPMRRLLWTIAQHKYGWCHCPGSFGPERRLPTAEALERRGLVAVDRSRPHMPTCSATDAGRAEIEQLFPVSPFILRTYDHQPGGWTPLDEPDRDREAPMIRTADMSDEATAGPWHVAQNELEEWLVGCPSVDCLAVFGAGENAEADARLVVALVNTHRDQLAGWRRFFDRGARTV